MLILFRLNLEGPFQARQPFLITTDIYPITQPPMIEGKLSAMAVKVLRSSR